MSVFHPVFSIVSVPFPPLPLQTPVLESKHWSGSLFVLRDSHLGSNTKFRSSRLAFRDVDNAVVAMGRWKRDGSFGLYLSPSRIDLSRAGRVRARPRQGSG